VFTIGATLHERIEAAMGDRRVVRLAKTRGRCRFARMTRLEQQRILVGVGGSIAAYRACDVVRRLRELGAVVRVAPTSAARAFVTPLTFEALSGAPCLLDVLDVDDGRIPHIEEAYATTCALVAPASADLLAKMAQGQADEALLATLLSYRGPLVVAPAMETRMWEHPATQASVRTLRGRGAIVVGPVEGALASGRSGAGRLASVEAIVEAVRAACAPQDLAGRRLLVTAGPTVEDVDPVRFLSNRSSGRMGVALAVCAARRGAAVTLVHGPMKAQVPDAWTLMRGASVGRLEAHAVRTAAEMHAVVLAHVVPGTSAEKIDGSKSVESREIDAAILCAAVADARPKDVAPQKIKKTAGALTSIALEPTPDILAALGERRRGAGDGGRFVLVGFAAETQDVEKHARDKLERKRCDLVCGNDVSEEGAGFDVETNRLLLVRRHGPAEWLAPSTKEEAADRVLDEVLALLTTRAPSSPAASAGP
jgi:phosphopantothenoylcysteine decarboxylase/phosphopantothenate--cysteine ligase